MQANCLICDLCGAIRAVHVWERKFTQVWYSGSYIRTLPQMNVKLENEAALMNNKVIILQMKFNKGFRKSFMIGLPLLLLSLLPSL